MEQQPSSPPPVSVVVGAGPAGILSAVLLARRGHEVHLLDKRPSPLEQDASDQHRAFFVVLHARGAAALAAAGFDLAAAAAEPGSGLQAVRAIGMGRGAALHQRRVAFQTPRILGPRHAFVRAMVAQAQGMGLPNLHLHWGAAFDSLDLASKTATFRRCSPFCSGPGSPSGGGGHAMHDGSGDGAPASGSGGCGGCNGGAAGAFTLAYDLLVAADGGWSRVRGAAAAQAPELQASVQPADAHYKVFRRLPASLLAPLGAADGGSGSASTGGSVPDVGSQADIDAGDGVQLRFVLGSGAGGFRPAAVMFLAAEPGEPGAVRGMLSIASQQAWEGLQEAGQAEAFLAAQFPALPPEWIPQVGRRGSGRAGTGWAGRHAKVAAQRPCISPTPTTHACLLPPPPPALQIAAQLAEAPLAMAGMRVRCSQLHAPSLVLVGDAAHGVTPRTGNGMNASLESAWVLDQVGVGEGGVERG